MGRVSVIIVVVGDDSRGSGFSDGWIGTGLGLAGIALLNRTENRAEG